MSHIKYNIMQEVFLLLDFFENANIEPEPTSDQS